jgi:hypothetical protein
MPARHFVSVDSQAFTRHPTLELGWKKPIVTANKHAGWNGRPRLDVARRCEHGLGLARLTLRQRIVNDRLRYVMEEVDRRVSGSSR